MRKFMPAIILIFLLSSLAFGQGNSGNAPGHTGEKNENKGETPKRPDDHDDKAPVQVGWAVVSAATTSGTVNNLAVFATFGLKRGDETAQAGLLPADLSLSSVMFVSTNGKLSRNMGLAIANPSTTADAKITMALHDEDGKPIATKDFVVEKGHQTAQFITSLFADRAAVPKDLTGTVSITSNIPVSMVGLRFRGANFSTIPVTNLSPSTGRGIVIPEFAAGGGWATELVLVNTGTERIAARADFFKQDGTPMTVRLNGDSKSSFTDLVIQPYGALELAPKDSEGDSRF
jgi:hypothetical protein